MERPAMELKHPESVEVVGEVYQMDLLVVIVMK